MHIFNLKINNTDFICNHKQVAQRVLLWEDAFFQASTCDIDEMVKCLMGVLNAIRTASATIPFYSRRLRK